MQLLNYSQGRWSWIWTLVTTFFTEDWAGFFSSLYWFYTSTAPLISMELLLILHLHEWRIKYFIFGLNYSFGYMITGNSANSVPLGFFSPLYTLGFPVLWDNSQLWPGRIALLRLYVDTSLSYLSLLTQVWFKSNCTEAKVTQVWKWYKLKTKPLCFSPPFVGIC